VVSDSPKLLDRKAWPGAGGLLPSIGARVSHEDGLGGQPVIIVLGLNIGERETKRSRAVLRRSKFVSDGGVEPAQGGGGHAPTLFLVEGYALSEELGVDGS